MWNPSVCGAVVFMLIVKNPILYVICVLLHGSLAPVPAVKYPTDDRRELAWEVGYVPSRISHVHDPHDLIDVGKVAKILAKVKRGEDGEENVRETTV